MEALETKFNNGTLPPMKGTLDLKQVPWAMQVSWIGTHKERVKSSSGRQVFKMEIMITKWYNKMKY